ncbi:MAG: hypothetical protein ACR2PR_09085 [Pseudohongiellaceae bacterium]
MPIRAEMKDKYPKNWKAISWVIRSVRAGWRCEGSPKYPDCRAAHGEPHPTTGNMVCLTVAHLNHNPADCRPDNLRAMCNRCHLVYDAAHHWDTTKIKRGYQWLWAWMRPNRDYENRGAN